MAGKFGEHQGESWAEVFAQTVALAFRDDPTWSPVIESTGNPDTAVQYWKLFVHAAQHHPWLGSTSNAEAVSVWLPPGAAELTAADEEKFPHLVLDWFGPAQAAELTNIIEQFETATPEAEYFYLSLLATHPAHQGRGHGMKLLADNLQELDRLGVPTYLESSNPANDFRYERLGYERHGSINLPSGLQLATFWRDPQPVTQP